MKLCIPSTNEAGLDARVSPHFGSAPWYTLVDTETGAVEPLANAHARHEHGQCQPTRGLEGLGIGAVVCRGLGGRALARLEAAGMAVFVTEAFTVGAAVEAFREGRVARMTAAEACQDHGGHHEHGHHGLTPLYGAGGAPGEA